MEIANKSLFIDLKAGNITIVSGFNGKTLEMKYFLRNSSEVSQFLRSRNIHMQDVQHARNSQKFSRVICRFEFGKYHPSIKLQQTLVDFQNGVFDDITVQMIKDDVSSFDQMLSYARKYEMPISTLIDIRLHVMTLTAAISVIQRHNPSATKWKYHKMDSYIDRYRLISQMIRELGIPYDLVACNKRCGINNYKDISVSIIARGFFGFRGCCLDFKAPLSRSGKHFSPHTDVFNDVTYNWDKQINDGNYKDIRAQNLLKLDQSSVAPLQIASRPLVNNLFGHLSSL